MEIDRIRISPASALKKTAGTSNLTHGGILCDSIIDV